MSNLLEITGEDIAALKDADLRNLIGLLCEAENRASNLSTSGITYGGHQDAGDGGIDVQVDNTSPPSNGFITRATTGIQVKKPKMAKSEILKEMKPKGILRPEIKTLIDCNGAYLIVSSGDSTTATTLARRRDAMREAIAGESDNENLHVDFFDRDRVAIWVRCHPSLILWAREKIGKPIIGWHPYNNWSNSPNGVEDKYLIDDKIRINDDTRAGNPETSIEEGIERFRTLLNRPKTSIRLAGLSGVGKTRFAQVLFDDRIGKNALNKSQVYYTDISNSPVPEPGLLMEQLVTQGIRSIVIVDNCSRELHERLTKIINNPKSELSLLTIEYDVRDDLPEETHVFRLEPASQELIEKIIADRFGHISPVDVSTIAEFSGGNSRIAIALANTVSKGDSLAGLKNENLFERLFIQRYENDLSLLNSACVLSLVYSFDGVDTASDDSELYVLSDLIDITPNHLYPFVDILRKRDLVQARGQWRAVLPHALANRLAARALNMIPKDKLVSALTIKASERLTISFSRRLSYLHENDIAVEIVTDWLQPDGWIGNCIENLNSFGIKLFQNIAPVSPENTLRAIENASERDDNNEFTSRQNKHFSEFTRLIRKLAYSQPLFLRSARLLCKFALSEHPKENREPVGETIQSLFYIYLSGTHATVDDRLTIIKELVHSEDPAANNLGFRLLNATLEAWHFSSDHNFDFGARSRDYGYEPKTSEDVTNWYSTFIDFTAELSCLDREISEHARTCLAENLRGLWTKAGMHDKLIEVSKKVHEVKAWNQGWLSVRSIIKYDSQIFDEEVNARLNKMEAALKPDTLLEKARTFITNDRLHDLELVDEDDDTQSISDELRAIDRTSQELGQKVAREKPIFEELLPILLLSESVRTYYFGKGLALGSPDISETWECLLSQFSTTKNEVRQIRPIVGFLEACNDLNANFYDQALDDMVTDELFGEWFPCVQIMLGIDLKGFDRLRKSLQVRKADIFHYNRLAYGRAHEILSDEKLVLLMQEIMEDKRGEYVVIEILKMRFHRNKGEAYKYSEELLEFACKILAEYTFKSHSPYGKHEDYDLSVVAETCLNSKIGSDYAPAVFDNISNALINRKVSAYKLTGLLNSIAILYPTVFLDCFIKLEYENPKDYKYNYLEELDRRENPISGIKDDTIISWCNSDQSIRLMHLLHLSTLFKMDKDTDKLVWRPFVLHYIDQLDNLDTILNCMAESIWPRSWSGSLAKILEKRVTLFDQLLGHTNDEVRSWAQRKKSENIKQIDQRKNEENQRYNSQQRSFE